MNNNFRKAGLKIINPAWILGAVGILLMCFSILCLSGSIGLFLLSLGFGSVVYGLVWAVNRDEESVKKQYAQRYYDAAILTIEQAKDMLKVREVLTSDPEETNRLSKAIEHLNNPTVSVLRQDTKSGNRGFLEEFENIHKYRRKY